VNAAFDKLRRVKGGMWNVDPSSSQKNGTMPRQACGKVNAESNEKRTEESSRGG